MSPTARVSLEVGTTSMISVSTETTSSILPEEISKAHPEPSQPERSAVNR